MMFSSRMRRVSGEKRRVALGRRRSSDGVSPAAARGAASSRCPSAAAIRARRPCSPNLRPGSGVAVSVSDAIKRFDLLELAVDLAELAAHALDVAVDRAVVDVDRL